MKYLIRISKLVLKDGEGNFIPVGTEFEVDNVPPGWSTYVDVVREIKSEAKVAVTNPDMSEQKTNPDDKPSGGDANVQKDLADKDKSAAKKD